MRKIRELDFEAANQMLRYEPETGHLFWLRKQAGRRAGERAGTSKQKAGNSYYQIQIFGKGYLVHRIAWLLMTGKWPADCIDHINCQKDDNRWVNLRPATKQQNSANSIWLTERDLPKGVHRHHTGRYAAAIAFNGKKIHLGMFDVPELAAAAYADAAHRYFGEFARTS